MEEDIGQMVQQRCSPQQRLYSQLLSPIGKQWSFLGYRVRARFCNSRYIRNYHVTTAGNSITYHAQVAWKRFSRGSFYRGHTSNPIYRLTQAITLALSRSHVVVPGLFALTCGNVAWAQASTNSDIYQPSNSLYTNAQNGHVFLTTVVHSAFEGVVLLLRALYLSILFSPSILMAPFVDSLRLQYRKHGFSLFVEPLERAGPAFIKWGQWAATRPDLFPIDLCTELSKLHAKAPEHSFSYTKKSIERSFGRKISEIFEDFEEAPVASGSIAQVYRASLKCRYSGRENKPMVVAVKVRHPGVGDSIRRDFQIINIVAKTSKFIPALNWLRLDESLQQFAVFVMCQVDLAREASHLSRFIYNFRRWKNVSFPKPVYPLVHPAVLVETFEQGESVSHYVDELRGHERLKISLAHIGTHALLKMLLDFW
ncbi:hypothetical protein ACET3Z_008171 [Daucus carota]|uniref:ABC1 atypical kinase-like domain-containing protein n=1 Tax=Daucus carota subsp. sativus TaxID=79200 RepID=A0A166F242_DAUCS